MYRTKRHLRVSILCIVAAVLGMSCQTDTVYHSYRSIPLEGWKKSDTLYFAFTVTDSLKPYRVTVEIRNEEAYPYRELYLFLHRFNTKDSTLFVTDTLRCVLADQAGKWKGTGLGAVYQSVHAYADLPILYTGDYKIGITQGMKDEILPGINDIGINVEKRR